VCVANVLRLGWKDGAGAAGAAATAPSPSPSPSPFPSPDADADSGLNECMAALPDELRASIESFRVAQRHAFLADHPDNAAFADAGGHKIKLRGFAPPRGAGAGKQAGL